MAQYKLNYFNLRGRGELIRYIFLAAGQPFEDNRIEFADWPSIKPTAPLGQMPFIEIIEGDKKTSIAQSMTICRHLARKFNLAGKDEMEQTYTDMYADQVGDLLTEFIKVHFEKEEPRKNELESKLTSETLPTNLNLFEKRLAANNGFLSGSSLTYADLYLSIVLELLGEKKDSVLSAYPNVKKLDESVRNHERLKAYIAMRPVTAI